jgi:Tol biopolymer transport system component
MKEMIVLDVATKEAKQITSGPYDDSSPVWSPDGRLIAFVSKRTEEPDSNQNSDIFLVSVDGGEPRRLTENPGADRSPAWSPDGNAIACVSVVKPDLIWYGGVDRILKIADTARRLHVMLGLS